MIIDQWHNIHFYKPLIQNFDKGLKAIREQMEKLETGRYEFEGGFFMVQKGETKPMSEGLFEAHRKYIDIQIIVKGSEEIAWEELADLTVEIPYNPEKDAEYLAGETKHHMLISEGMFYIAYPHDGHRPVRHTEIPLTFTKIVLKLPA
ncbi:YhcH/YjgK/YiaL family protein [Fusibacter sp. 3D3]|uniref:YhcH/YjgK/YiaL family protein n=1 Tax=Fusibacter sp. 3D3 TaxID=1048380 RepID=UPI000853B8C1|nr:YhcH/YjgK/YiaL family protein [Fusibacter sp. 3D3]GAU76477.1 hypothetical protein F3D3_1074 [Fusibacter sp. 3D3]